jgi:hypothetical protein
LAVLVDGEGWSGHVAVLEDRRGRHRGLTSCERRRRTPSRAPCRRRPTRRRRPR